MAKDKQKEFLESYEECSESLERYALSLARTREDARELVAKTIASAYERFRKVRDKKAFLAYLFTTARRLFFREIEQYHSRHSSLDAVVDFISGELSAEDKLDIKHLYKALEEIPQDQKEAILLFDIHGFSGKEIAKIQGTSTANVKIRIHRGKERLRKLLNDKWVPNS
jgi:RNA polymerase sigma-70 factor (ECF subfamily)